MESDDGDPLDWTVDEVVAFLCYNPETPWSQSASQAPRPNPVQFEAALRENLITGEVLLHDVDKETLREELGLKAIGHRNGSATTTSERPPSIAPPAEQRKDPSDPGDGVRAYEHIVVDAEGKKRRRLDLSSLPEPQKNPRASKSSNSPQDKDWYMGPDRILPSQLFYPTTSDEEDHSFVMLGPPNLPSAQRHFVRKQQPIQLSSDNESSQMALIPYDHSKVSERDKKFFTLYTATSGNVSVTQEDIKKWPQLEQAGAAGSPLSQTLEPSDPYSYLLQKYPAAEDNEDVCPLYGDSGSEGEFDEETWQEIANERDDTAQNKPVKLTPAEVDSVIEDCMAEFVNRWRQNGLPKEKYKARKLWITARRAKCTYRKVKAINRDITLLEKRLGKVLEAIRGSEYASKSELQTQCQSMEQTVIDIQKQKWRISVLEEERCPPKVASALKTKPLPKPKISAADEESLHSESDVTSDFQDDFIDDSEAQERVSSVENFGNVDSVDRIQTPASTPSTSESDDDIISPSGIRRKSRAKRSPFMATSSPSPDTSGDAQQAEIIDLTMDSPPASADEFRIETPPLNPVRPPRRTESDDVSLKVERSPSISPPPQLSSNVVVEIPKRRPEIINRKHEGSKSTHKSNTPYLPDHNDFDGLLSYPWELLEERHDRRRLLAKLIATMPDCEREVMASLIPEYEYDELEDIVKQALGVLSKGQEEIPELDSEKSRLLMRAASQFVSWVNCMYMEKAISRKRIRKAQEEIADFRVFHKELCKGLGLCKGRKFDREPSEKSTRTSSEHVEESEGEKSERVNTPHRKRKKEVKESQDAKRNQASAQQRVARQEKERRRLEHKMKLMGVSNTDPTRQAVSFGDPTIYLDPHIGQRVKPHQLNGIQFMWRELIQDEKQQGCLLAHTMGLGKTMQVISLLNTISAAAASNDPKISEQVPECFHRSQTLILCPSSLIDNWYEEFLMWTPEESRIGPLRKVTASMIAVSERLREVSDWDKEGGILIMSYDIFRKWIHNKETKKMQKPLRDDEHANVKKWLLEGPNIIVADEAHKMKNSTSGISRAAVQFRSKSRIALTGSPLANNLTDYYTMVDWIAKGYLGEFPEFKANYVEPIEEGLYVDSTHYERRKSLKKLQVLKEILEPKVNRAAITVLEGDMPPKVEFVITVPLTELQRAAYDSYVDSVVQGKTEVGTAKLWTWMAILGLCNNHPACFRDKLLSRANEAQRAGSSLDEMLPGDESITQAGIPDSEKLVSEQERLFAKVPDMNALNLSYRAQLLDRIISESIKAGDKVLVFSHSIPTLDYVEHVLKVSKRSYRRLDGKTPISTRQAATKSFNTVSEEKVYLISTRAGGLGLNIPGANRVVIFDFSFNPIWEEQAVGRAYRLGQQKPVFVYRFIAGGTFEEIIYNKAIFKTQLAVRVVDKKNPIRWASKKLNEYLFPAKSVKQHDISEFVGKDPHVLDKIIKEDNGEERAIRKIALTETFQREDNDKLTEEERKDVQQELDEERLRRTDPQAYQRLIFERQRREELLRDAARRREAERLATMVPIPILPIHYAAAQQSRAPSAQVPPPSTAPTGSHDRGHRVHTYDDGPFAHARNRPILPLSQSTSNAELAVSPSGAVDGTQPAYRAQTGPPQHDGMVPSASSEPSSPYSPSSNPPLLIESRGASAESEPMQSSDGGSSRPTQSKDGKKDGGSSCKTQ
ncbi:putative SNF2 family helicase/ATPase [Aspergillus novofumigatus IBT 16806]|uniref:Putative SNF2 family helicase/ATPase n=1 Tax=Aspergillus novofumigatus (strain IBT 16806) TaxID=1392255 RepID=A0A2I1CGV1_ASPN1|nr:putative SNF2 family helicase/ATPase [Aspergillus novofumigatus IBT 16806]PKX96856.1 putative SNF2 family helicase/ATPase [Aspergillus novofumigatus IBT 16806]